MPNTAITKDKLKNHWAYSKKIYLFMTLVAVGLASILYTIVTNRNPADYKYVGIALVGSYADTSRLEADEAELLARGQAYDENLEKLEFMGISYTGEGTSEMDYYGQQLYIVQLSSGDNDIFIQSQKLAVQLIDEEALKELDTLPSFEFFTAKYPDAIVWTETKRDKTDEDDEDEDDVIIERHAYNIDVSQLLGFNERGAFDIRGMYAGVLAKSANPDTALYTLYQMFELFSPTATEAETQE